MMHKKWIYKSFDKTAVVKTAEKYNISELTAMVLHNREEIIGGCLCKDEQELINMLYDPFLLDEMAEAADTIRKSLSVDEKITVYGDYDADGVTATAVLYSYLQTLGANVDYYVPNRLSEGYGMNTAALDKIASTGTKLIITVDTGISAAEQIDYCQKLGIKVVVTDHHECGGELPRCSAVINPKKSSCGYPFKSIAGVGVAFKLITALNGGAAGIAEKYMPLVCLGTIADVMPLTNENRIFALLGLMHLKKPLNVGLEALIKSAGVKTISAGTVAFALAPRINAAGRLGVADKSLELFLNNDGARCAAIADELCRENVQRQNIERQIFDEAVGIIEANRLYNEAVIVIAGEGWHSGVIGIVSSKITERYYRPSILLTVENGNAKGSGRSISGFNLFEALCNTGDDLEAFGGHELAAGLSLKTENIVTFRQNINNYARTVMKADDLVPTLNIDARLSNRHIKLEYVSELAVLEPYGMGNPTPVFALCGMRVLRIGTMSEGRHIRIILERDGMMLNAVGFNMGELKTYICEGETVDAAGNLAVNEYNGSKSVQLLLKDIKKAQKGR